jgi:UDP-N-acetyl-2-amino-2-deoxyglucuronate dehydrogenase
MDGGGPFIQQGSHMLDMVLWLCGGYNEVLDAKRFQVYHDIETEDHGYAIIRYNNGAVGMIEASTASFGLSKDVIEISGTKGSISANYDQLISFEVEGMEAPEFDKKSDLFVQLITDFMQSVETGREPFINGDSASLTTELVVDIYEKSGEPIKTLLEK